MISARLFVSAQLKRQQAGREVRRGPVQRGRLRHEREQRGEEITSERSEETQSEPNDDRRLAIAVDKAIPTGITAGRRDVQGEKRGRDYASAKGTFDECSGGGVTRARSNEEEEDRGGQKTQKGKGQRRPLTAWKYSLSDPGNRIRQRILIRETGSEV